MLGGRSLDGVVEGGTTGVLEGGAEVGSAEEGPGEGTAGADGEGVTTDWAYERGSKATRSVMEVVWSFMLHK